MDDFLFPYTSSLTSQLEKVFAAAPFSADAVEVVSRYPFAGTSTFPTEVIHCRLSDGSTLSLLGKYLAGRGANNHGHRGGVEYEIKIYDEVIRHLPLSKIQFYGKCYFEENNETLMLLEFLENGGLLRCSQDYSPCINASEWIAGMHLFFENKEPGFVKVYDESYYRVWPERMLQDKNIIEARPWVADLAFYFLDNLSILTDTPQTLIHGEYYKKNILYRDGIVYPIDWESAAFAPGEIDLACLIEAREEAAVFKMIDKYKLTRWPGSDKGEEFEQRLLMAQLYLHFRFFYPKQEDWRFDYMQDLSRQLKVI